MIIAGFVILMLAIYTADWFINKQLGIRLENELLKLENESLDEGRRSWRAEAKKRRVQVKELREELEFGELLIDNYTYSVDQLIKIVHSRDEEIANLQTQLKEAKSKKKTKTAKKGK